MISPLAYVDPSAKLGKDVTVYPFAFIDRDTVIGDRCTIMPHASVMKGARIGCDTKIYNGATVGADPQDFRWKGNDSYCYVGNRVTIRENALINRGIGHDGGTRIADDCFIMAKAHICHDSDIAERCVVGNGAVVAGSVQVGRGCILSSNSILHEDVKVGEYVLVKGGCRLASNVPPYIIVAHNPSVYFGVNSVILKKHAQFDDEQIETIAKAYRFIYKSTSSLFNALLRIEADIDPCDVRDAIVSFIRTNDNKIVAGNTKQDA